MHVSAKHTRQSSPQEVTQREKLATILEARSQLAESKETGNDSEPLNDEIVERLTQQMIEKLGEKSSNLSKILQQAVNLKKLKKECDRMKTIVNVYEVKEESFRILADAGQQLESLIEDMK
uniref:Uncharacterized protein n=1 Tax=Chromera velia CCMP2878 TaxID=1169474 RepID=A0A0G4I332_9ALVE|mmetsp:Transcript_44038/g.86939  ORF Transcript_44038/g.86939 Transcript_44038/m.86939 type:complete len:121 (+) Transcript_44038:352-714(+)|eukprot:Cvel_1735.t1-p1 / transcript=Cvel_1735.t1 / gene=Cvel_1735 / organism=Chromera_velia_CCMP2878 / gene_product=hypothetical protein / transcript_product=hypothetical protein / location=Cvel_scaffold63:55082-57197(+) / protein_length=120 / sequence_SO=supercontig / SO=protein_coding / is_pseudo=false